MKRDLLFFGMFRYFVFDQSDFLGVQGSECSLGVGLACVRHRDSNVFYLFVRVPDTLLY